MKRNNISRSALSVIAAVLLVALVPFFRVNADSDKPKIKTIENISSREVQLPFTWEKYAHKKNVDVKVKVRIQNMKTGAVTIQTLDTRVNGNGHGKVWIKNLSPSTDYGFKLKIRKITLKDFSDYSNKKSVMTTKAASTATSSAATSESTAPASDTEPAQ